jgi:hypothetical protein
MPTTDRAAAGQPQPDCTREDHEQMKRDARAFRRGTRKLGVQGNGKQAPELRNCTRCGSTLTAPPRKVSDSATE